MSQRAKTYPPLPDYDIYLYDLARQKELAVFQNSFGQEELIDISGDKIAWLSQEGWRYSVSYSRPTEICQYVNRYLLRMYDISSGFTYQVQDITASTGRQLSDPTGISFSQNRFASERVISYRDAEDRLMMDDVLQLTSVYFLPQIETIEPRIANPGQEVSVQGLNFGFEQETEGRCQVLVNGEVANEVRIWQDKEIRLLLPKGLPEGRAKIQVKTPGGESNQFELAVAGGGAGYSLAIDAERGAVSRIPDKAIYSAGEKVELTVTADRGYKFERWSGDLSGSANPAVVTMDAHKYIKACFVPELFTVNITALNGTVSKTPDKSGYLYGERLKLTATANPKYIFKKWEGDLSTTANPVTITVDADKTILANFIPAAPSPPPYKIIMKSLPLGAGTISRSPFKIFYNRGEEVTLTAHPKPGYYFANWSGDAKGCTNQATIIMDDNKNIEANFYEGGYVLNIETSPTNSGSIARSPDTEAYMAGSTVLLTSTPAAGFRFSGWAGDISGSENPAIVIMDAHKNITAKFSPKIECYLLEITAPNGSVQKVPDKTTYTHGEVVTLTAVPDPGYQFDSWSGDISGKENPAAISMDGTKNIAANFSLKPNSPPAAVITSPASGSRLKPPITITADASDIDGTIKKLEFFDGTTKLGEDTSFPYAYTWDSPSKGRHIITARATDNNDDSTPSAEVEIEVLGNTAPMAYDSSVSTQEDNQIAVVMHAEDADNDKLNYSIMSAPANGRLRWPYEPDGDTIYYIPNADYFGTDSFSFRVYDGEAYSNIATVTISAEPVDDKPEIVEVKVGAVILMAGESTSLKVEAVDVDTDNLSYLWEATEGTIISPQSSQTSYRAPSEVSSDTAVTLTVTVRDASSAASRSTAVTVIKKPAIRHSLNILAVNGRVEKRVGGVETPETSFPEGTVVELTAIPNSGYEFSHWKGTSVVNQNQTSRNPINVVIDKDIFLAASFRCNFTPRFLGIYSYSQSPFIAQRSKTNPNYYILTIAERKFAILGWKKPGTAVYLNGRLIARLDNNDYWRYYYDGSRGVSDLNFYAQDTNGNKSDNLTIQVILR
jgi:hypothetical protein